MRRRITKPITEFKVGDIYCEDNSDRYVWLIEKIEKTEDNYILWHSKRVKGPINSRLTDSFTFRFAPKWHHTGLMQMIERTCAPCYDSDCDCIYDALDGAGTVW